MSLRQLLPVLDVIGNANKHLARVAKFLSNYGDLALFPVKLQVRSTPPAVERTQWAKLQRIVGCWMR